jgi:hypothetical protein
MPNVVAKVISSRMPRTKNCTIVIRPRIKYR